MRHIRPHLRPPFAVGAIVCMAIASLARAQTTDTAPAASSQPSTRATTGTIVGVLKSPSPVTRILAIDRIWRKADEIDKDNLNGDSVYPGKLDPKTGDFLIPNLLVGRTYDLIVFNQQARWEGVTMDYHRVVTPDKDPVTDEDKAWLKEFVEKEKAFENKKRILWMAADHKHATLLVELIRDTEFYAGKSGEIICRVELWYFENYFGGWAKDRNTEVVVTRWRGPGGKMPALQFVPQLGAITIPDNGQPPPLTITLPEKPDPRRGTVGEK